MEDLKLEKLFSVEDIKKDKDEVKALEEIIDKHIKGKSKALYVRVSYFR